MVLLYDRDERAELCYEMMALHTVYESGGSFLALFFNFFFKSSKLKLEEETVSAPKVASGEVTHTPGKVALFVVLAVHLCLINNRRRVYYLDFTMYGSSCNYLLQCLCMAVHVILFYLFILSSVLCISWHPTLFLWVSTK